MGFECTDLLLVAVEQLQLISEGIGGANTRKSGHVYSGAQVCILYLPKYTASRSGFQLPSITSGYNHDYDESLVKTRKSKPHVKKQSLNQGLRGDLAAVCMYFIH